MSNKKTTNQNNNNHDDNLCFTDKSDALPDFLNRLLKNSTLISFARTGDLQFVNCEYLLKNGKTMKICITETSETATNNNIDTIY